MRKPTPRQMKLARLLLDGTYSKKEALRLAGYSASTQRVPQVIESQRGFQTACSMVAHDMGMHILALHKEIGSRDMSEYQAPELVDMLYTLSKAYKNIAVHA